MIAGVVTFDPVLPVTPLRLYGGTGLWTALRLQNSEALILSLRGFSGTKM